ncbi:MAG TPA: hypothetical protein VIA63_01630 [Candidatus Limnocylindria bacterium]
MRFRTLLATFAIFLISATVAAADTKFHEVKPGEFDPGKTYLVQAAWLDGLGCPTNARQALPNSDFSGVGSIGSYTDPACPDGDSRDKRNDGLVLAKTGPTNNFAAAGAELKDVRGITLTELGFDIRKAGAPLSAMGSHCGGGAPRWNIQTSTGFFFVGCNSGTATPSASTGWTRLRWNAAALAAQGVTGTVQSIQIVFDEGTDTGPDFIGLAVLDNIDVNGVLVGTGPTDPN